MGSLKGSVFFFFLNDMFLGILIHLFDVLDVLDGG